MNATTELNPADRLRALRGLKVFEIQRIVSEFYRIDQARLREKIRTEPLATIRQLAMVLCRDLAGATALETAQAFNRGDHCTVLHAEKAIADKRTTDLSLQHQYTKLATLCRRALAEIE
jgi:chromosomal replication initiator protein